MEFSINPNLGNLCAMDMFFFFFFCDNPMLMNMYISLSMYRKIMFIHVKEK